MAVLRSTFQQQLISISESGQPVPVIRLVGGEILRNLQIVSVGTDMVTFEDPDTDGTMYVPINQVQSVGTF
ncbi:hypothetical protein J2Z23_004368 [Lederbergia galactosidilyticus]|uniref:hypothetical protein n=1 Tax=Lederbergia galactosidilytica TaxID=217031 RepID=UPI001AEA4CA9|nr:hypothetical protein [Lederbergia galactosidilytica]MBP1917366.1 hypothetical protein [Lederbergia galactosidilytica]